MKLYPGIFLFIILCSCSSQEEQSSPNIIYIMTDQQAFDAKSCAGKPLVHTTALDGLAEDGIRFEKAYCAYPLCVPSRAAIFT